jgi:polyisoprenoid-binding protein YceI
VTTFRIDPNRSKVWIEARSSMHPIHGEADGLEGSIEADVADGRIDVAGVPKISIELPVEKLQSGRRLEDAEMMRRIDARRYPMIRGETTEFKENGGNYRVRGDLTFHGVTRPVEGEVIISAPDERSLLIEGEQVFDIREFGVEPPKILMLRVHPDVRVRIKVVAQQDSCQ